jgi:hypothetical protein
MGCHAAWTDAVTDAIRNVITAVVAASPIAPVTR